MKAAPSFWLGNKYLGQASGVMPAYLWHSAKYNRDFNYIFLCQRCGDVWLRVYFHNHATWAALHCPCEKHGGGSILEEHFYTFNQHMHLMPYAVKARELMNPNLNPIGLTMS